MRDRIAFAVAVAAAALAGCSHPDVNRIRAADRARLAPQPPYAGVTRCGPDAPDAPPAPELGAEAGFVPAHATAAAGRVVSGYLDKELVSRPIRARAGAIRRCYLGLLAVDPDADGGRITAKFQIVADGSVADVEISGWDARLDACVCEEIAGLRYPQFGSARFGNVIVSYPFVFSR